ncbi:MAG: hypothetical protein ACFFDW_12745 [Candidatus Thorarchaeota archaeon]
MYFLEQFSGLMLQGVIEIIDDIESKKKLWEDGRYKHHLNGYSDLDFAILKLIPSHLEG